MGRPGQTTSNGYQRVNIMSKECCLASTNEHKMLSERHRCEVRRHVITLSHRYAARTMVNVPFGAYLPSYDGFCRKDVKIRHVCTTRLKNLCLFTIITGGAGILISYGLFPTSVSSFFDL